MQLKKLAQLTCFSLVFSSAVMLTAQAGNTSVNGVAARAQSMQAFTAVADDPSAIFYNPAGLTQITKPQVDTGITLIAPNQKYTNAINGVSTRSRKMSVAPNLFYASGTGQPLVYGFGLYAPFARATSYEANAAVFGFTNEAYVTRLDAVPTLAYRINQIISIGAGFILSHVRAGSDLLGLDESGSGFGLSGQGGVLFHLPRHVRIGIVYHGPETADISGHGQLLGIAAGHFNMKLRFPAMLSAGLAWQATTKLLVTLAIDREFWTHVKRNFRDYAGHPVLQPLGLTVINSRDSSVDRVGVDYRPDQTNEFTAGYSYNEAGLKTDSIVPALPDYYTNALSVGYSRYVKKFRFDIAYEYDFTAKRTGNNIVFPGTYKAHACFILLGIGYVLG